MWWCGSIKFGVCVPAHTPNFMLPLRDEVPSSEEISWVQSLLIDFWLLVDEVSTLSLNLLTTHTMVTTGILPPQGKSPWQSRESNPGPRDL